MCSVNPLIKQLHGVTMLQDVWKSSKTLIMVCKLRISIASTYVQNIGTMSTVIFPSDTYTTSSCCLGELPILCSLVFTKGYWIFSSPHLISGYKHIKKSGLRNCGSGKKSTLWRYVQRCKWNARRGQQSQQQKYCWRSLIPRKER